MKFRALTMREWNLLAVLFTVVLGASGYYFLYGPVQREVVGLWQQQKKLTAEAQNIQASPSVQRVTDTDLEPLLKQVPNNREESRLIYTINEIMKETGADLKNLELDSQQKEKQSLVGVLDSIQNGQPLLPNGSLVNVMPNQGNASTAVPAKPTTQAILKSIDFTVTVRGTYLQLESFIQKIGQTDRLIRLNSWTISRKQEQVKGIQAPISIQPLPLPPGLPAALTVISPATQKTVVSLDLTCTVFYADQDQLIPQLPAMDVQTPAGKKDLMNP